MLRRIVQGVEFFVAIGCEAGDLGVLECEHDDSGMMKPWKGWGGWILTFGYGMEWDGVRPVLV